MNMVWHVSAVSDDNNKAFYHLGRLLIENGTINNMTDDVSSTLRLKYGVLAFSCDCPQYSHYGACKHALYFTLNSCGWNVPINMRRAPIPGPRVARRGPGRPRRLRGALQLPSEALGM